MNCRFAKMNPSGNTTIFVLDPVPEKERAALSQRLMEETNLAAEQVGFLAERKPRRADLFVSMMGGEFCGNAVRAAAAWQLFCVRKAGGKEEAADYSVACTGLGRNVECHARLVSESVFDVSGEMPLPVYTDKVKIAKHDVWNVVFPGICHFCFFASEMPRAAERREVIDLILEACGETAEAIGILFYDGHRLNPFVYVRETDTLVNESSCGSGTAALAAALALETGDAVHIEAAQKGGLIYADAEMSEGRVTKLSIGGTVSVVAEGIAYVNL